MKLDLSKEFDRKKSDTYYEKLKYNNDKIELRKIMPIRSVRHNAYLHVCISIYAIEFGYSLNEAKILLKRRCDFMTYEKNGLKFLRETKKMKSDELTKFIEFIRNFSAKEGCYIPTSEEYITNIFDIDKHIESNKTFL